MPAIKKTEVTNAGYACDMCGAVISDGQHDGMGGVNWWGLNVEIVPQGKETVTVEREWNGYRVRISSKWTHPETWGLCKDCAAKVREFITANAPRQPEAASGDRLNADVGPEVDHG